ncbi:23S rRNA (adenine(2030)-N(6))-methyltransferase RlmJ [Motiliproteus sediminis]|uniref:23S rRNA (adenine(2030)-N(6))-methyltransferase RlmJ n=1 Tax=Motiliproteus sediminis TaxID=1468178 RepID=UPI001AF0265C|nr:23S rRNA (adenine(2030)-N(6))-methyltransferase RlmJ [Motiliproteus sediminis]
MLSYRHGFHAGNHADVLKHLVLVRCLQYLVQKPKPVCYLDTHAGGGAYSLADARAQKTGEYRDGIGRLWQCDHLPSPLQAYHDQVAIFCGASLDAYPGSPVLAAQLLRDVDRLLLNELHSSEQQVLKQRFAADRRVRVIEGDGYVGGLAALPPKERRGLVLIDPPYEIKSDYERVVKWLKDAHRRFATGIYALWYPVVDRARIDRLQQAIKASGIARIDLYELCVAPDTSPGMGGSGMVVINPPWQLRAEMEITLPWLAERLAPEGGGRYRIVELAGE